jgi:hypothetical protein
VTEIDVCSPNKLTKSINPLPMKGENIMRKYQELCDKLLMLIKIDNQSKKSFAEIFIEKLSKYLGCDTNHIRFNFEPLEFIKIDIFKFDFDLSIRIYAMKSDLTIILPGFSTECTLDENGHYEFKISYYDKTANLNENLIEIFDSIMHSLESEIEKSYSEAEVV